jgi:hypothetical protein
MLFALAIVEALSLIGVVCSVASFLLAVWHLRARKVRRTADDIRGHACSTPEQKSLQDLPARTIGASQDAIKARLIGTICAARSRGLTTIAADDLLSPLFDEFDAEDVHAALADLRRERVVDWNRAGFWVEEPNVPISLLRSDDSRRWLAAA